MVSVAIPIFKKIKFLAPIKNRIQQRIQERAQKPKLIEVEILGPEPRVEKWTVEKAEKELSIQSRYIVPSRFNKSKVMYCVFPANDQFYPVPLDRKMAILSDEPEDHLEKVTANTQQVYHMEKQQVRRKRYSRKGSAMQKAQATMYVLLAGGLGFLLFIIFSEVTDKS